MAEEQEEHQRLDMEFAHTPKQRNTMELTGLREDPHVVVSFRSSKDDLTTDSTLAASNCTSNTTRTKHSCNHPKGQRRANGATAVQISQEPDFNDTEEDKEYMSHWDLSSQQRALVADKKVAMPTSEYFPTEAMYAQLIGPEDSNVSPGSLLMKKTHAMAVQCPGCKEMFEPTADEGTARDKALQLRVATGGSEKPYAAFIVSVFLISIFKMGVFSQTSSGSHIALSVVSAVACLVHFSLMGYRAKSGVCQHVTTQIAVLQEVMTFVFLIALSVLVLLTHHNGERQNFVGRQYNSDALFTCFQLIPVLGLQFHVVTAAGYGLSLILLLLIVEFTTHGTTIEVEAVTPKVIFHVVIALSVLFLRISQYQMGNLMLQKFVDAVQERKRLIVEDQSIDLRTEAVIHPFFLQRWFETKPGEPAMVHYPDAVVMIVAPCYVSRRRMKGLFEAELHLIMRNVSQVGDRLSKEVGIASMPTFHIFGTACQLWVILGTGGNTDLVETTERVVKVVGMCFDIHTQIEHVTTNDGQPVPWTSTVHVGDVALGYLGGSPTSLLAFGGASNGCFAMMGATAPGSTNMIISDPVRSLCDSSPDCKIQAPQFGSLSQGDGELDMGMYRVDDVQALTADTSSERGILKNPGKRKNKKRARVRVAEVEGGAHDGSFIAPRPETSAQDVKPLAAVQGVVHMKPSAMLRKHDLAQRSSAVVPSIFEMPATMTEYGFESFRHFWGSHIRSVWLMETSFVFRTAAEEQYQSFTATHDRQLEPFALARQVARTAHFITVLSLTVLYLVAMFLASKEGDYLFHIGGLALCALVCLGLTIIESCIGKYPVPQTVAHYLLFATVILLAGSMEARFSLADSASLRLAFGTIGAYLGTSQMGNVAYHIVLDFLFVLVPSVVKAFVWHPPGAPVFYPSLVLDLVLLLVGTGLVISLMVARDLRMRHLFVNLEVSSQIHARSTQTKRAFNGLMAQIMPLRMRDLMTKGCTSCGALFCTEVRKMNGHNYMCLWWEFTQVKGLHLEAAHLMLHWLDRLVSSCDSVYKEYTFGDVTVLTEGNQRNTRVAARAPMGRTPLPVSHSALFSVWASATEFCKHYAQQTEEMLSSFGVHGGFTHGEARYALVGTPAFQRYATSGSDILDAYGYAAKQLVGVNYSTSTFIVRKDSVEHAVGITGDWEGARTFELPGVSLRGETRVRQAPTKYALTATYEKGSWRQASFSCCHTSTQEAATEDTAAASTSTRTTQSASPTAEGVSYTDHAKSLSTCPSVQEGDRLAVLVISASVSAEQFNTETTDFTS